jgi:hypothetical protein
MLGQCGAMLIIIITVIGLANTDAIIAQGQNITNQTEIGEDQSISGRISGLDEDLQFGR